MERQRLITILEIAILSAMAYVLGLVQIGVFWAQGGSISLVMIPLVVLSIRRGIGAGIIGGTIVGLLKLMFGGYYLMVTQVLLDYPVAFAVVGLAGMFKRSTGKSSIYPLVAGVVVAGFVRYLVHFLSGVIFFASYTPEGWNPIIWSIAYNGSYMIPEIIITSVVVVILYRFQNILMPTRQGTSVNH